MLAIVSPFPPEISGIGQYAWHLAQGLADTGQFARVHVLKNHSPTPSAFAENFTCESVWAKDDPRAAFHIVRALQKLRPTVVWFNLGFSVFGPSRAANFWGFTAPLLARRAGLPVVVTLHEVVEMTALSTIGLRPNALTRLGARLATHLLLQANAVTVTLRRYADYLHSAYGARHVHHIPHGAFVRPEALPTTPHLAPEILMLSTFAPHKGLPVLLEAFEHVRRLHPHARLTLAGSDHPRFPGYVAEMQARTNGTAHWRTALSEAQLREAFAQASVVVLPYLAATGASSVIHRAAAWGRPLVVSDLPDFRVIAAEENLHMDFVPPAEPLALAAALLALLAAPARQQAMAQHNLQAMHSMSLAATSARYAELLCRVAHE